MTEKRTKIKIGIVGYSGKSFPIYKAFRLLRNSIYGHLYTYREESGNEAIHVEIVSGYTDYGVPALAYCLADLMRCMPTDTHNYLVSTTGIACERAHKLNVCDVDELSIHGANWGDESEAFVEHIDVLIRIGGGPQSLKEVEMFKKLKPNAVVIEHELESYN